MTADMSAPQDQCATNLTGVGAKPSAYFLVALLDVGGIL